MLDIDTNVLSALMHTAPEAEVARWLDDQPAESIRTTGLTLFETRLGIALLPKGRRRQLLDLACDPLLGEDLEYRVLDSDGAAAAEAAASAASRQHAGRSVELRDTLIAGSAGARATAVDAR